MASRSNQPHHRRRKGHKAGTQPDDYFAAGPFEFARFGRLVVSRSRASPEDWKAAQAKMAADFPRIVAEIDELVGRIADRVSRFAPERLLHRAWGERALLAIGLAGDDVSDFDTLVAMRMIDYVQSVIAAVTPTPPYLNKMPDEDWAALSSDIETLFTRLALDYQIGRTASLRAQDPSLDMELEEFRFRAETLWMNVRGDRYQVHERQALVDVLTPHSDVLVRLFGISASALIDELDKILIKQTRGLHDVLTDMEQFREDVLERMSELVQKIPDTSEDEIRSRVFEDSHLSNRRERIGGEFFGLDLFDVEKVTAIPRTLLNELTWSPGEDQTFFAPGEFRGWPLRPWPTMKRPFIRLNGRILCFDASSLFDNIYRVLQRIVWRLEPAYGDTWNARQNAASEALPSSISAAFYPARASTGRCSTRQEPLPEVFSGANVTV
jgi:hypothetical protein